MSDPEARLTGYVWKNKANLLRSELAYSLIWKGFMAIYRPAGPRKQSQSKPFSYQLSPKG